MQKKKRVMAGLSLVSCQTLGSQPNSVTNFFDVSQFESAAKEGKGLIRKILKVDPDEAFLIAFKAKAGELSCFLINKFLFNASI